MLGFHPIAVFIQAHSCHLNVPHFLEYATLLTPVQCSLGKCNVLRCNTVKLCTLYCNNVQICVHCVAILCKFVYTVLQYRANLYTQYFNTVLLTMHLASQTWSNPKVCRVPGYIRFSLYVSMSVCCALKLILIVALQIGDRSLATCVT